MAYGLSIKPLLHWLRPEAGLLKTARIDDTVVLFVQDTDNRGVRLHGRIAAKRDISAAARLWRTLSVELQPGLCVDVGANYGEVSLLSTYQPNQKTYLIEANPYLVRALRRSVRTHATHEQIEIVKCFAGETASSTSFHIDLKWSGTSSAYFRSKDSKFKGAGKQSHRTLKVGVRAIDDIVGIERATVGAGVLMKIDVEGAELQALRGARQTLKAGLFTFLIVECNTSIIARSGGDAAAWLEEVAQLGEVFLIENRRLVKSGPSTIDLSKRTKYDLAIIRDDSPDQNVLALAARLTF